MLELNRAGRYIPVERMDKMRIIDGKRFYAKDMAAAVAIDKDGWDSYDGRNHQWYTLLYDRTSGYTELCANNSGDCYGDYTDRYFSSPMSFYAWAMRNERDIEALLGNVAENDADAMDFCGKIWPENDKAPVSHL